MNIIIVDDEPRNIEAVKLILGSIRKDVRVLGEAYSADEALQLIEQHREALDILLLDIQMPGGDGFYLLDQLKTIDFSIIFITAYDQFAIKAIRFSALDYLLKPVDPQELTKALERFDAQSNRDAVAEFKTRIRQNNYFEKIALTTLTDTRFIPIQSIQYFKSDNSYCTIFLDNDEKLVSSKNIGFYEELLHERNFFRCHNSYLINISRVTRLTKGKNRRVELDNRVLLDVSERRKDDLEALLGL